MDVNNPVSIIVPLFNDNIYEGTENFVANLVMISSPSPIIEITPDRATVIITDDDSEYGTKTKMLL